MPSRPDRTRELTFHLDTLTYGGEALGRVEGKAIFVTGGLPGEVVRVVVEDERARFARGRVIEVIESSPDRITPRCPHFGFDSTSCGGCQWQHIDYAAQLRSKTAIVREQLQRLGRVPDPPVRDIIPSPAIWQYRNHAQFHRTPDGQPGFQAARSHRVVAIDECHIIEPALLDWLRSNRRAVTQADRVSVRFGNTPDRLNGATMFRIKDATLRVSDESFFQVNTSLIETLIDQVLAECDPQPADTILDAYCGVGLFSRFLAPRADRVIGVESSASAVRDFRLNLAAFDRVEVHHGLVEEVLSQLTLPLQAAVLRSTARRMRAARDRGRCRAEDRSGGDGQLRSGHAGPRRAAADRPRLRSDRRAADRSVSTHLPYRDHRFVAPG